MKRWILFLGLLFYKTGIVAQQPTIADLREQYRMAKTDSARQNACLDLTTYYNEVNRDSALYFIEERLLIAKKTGYKLMEAAVLNLKGYQKIQTGKYAEALNCLNESLNIINNPINTEINRWRLSNFHFDGQERILLLSNALHQFGVLMRETENLDKEVEYFLKALELAKKTSDLNRQMVSSMNIGSSYLRKGLLDSALYYGHLSDSIASLPNFNGIFKGRNITNIGEVYFKRGDYVRAKVLYLKGLEFSKEKNNLFNVAVTQHKLAQLYLRNGQYDSALGYSKNNLDLLQLLKNGSNFQLNLGLVYEDIYLAYKHLHQKDSAYKYLSLTYQVKDSLYKVRITNLSAFQNVSFEETLRLENLEKAQIQTQAKVRLNSVIAGLIVVSFVGIILYRNNRQRKKSNMLLQVQKDEITLQKRQVEGAMEQLKATQKQLVQSEKMASLGELTAGIAHEIQNPLNFVNNFAEVNTELIDELKKEIEPAGIISANEIIEDIKANSEKITHHGKRADSIVKGMLQHSRKSSGQKELTDINALCDEYLRLSYHGLRAKDKSFNADFETKFDTALAPINVVPQDIGRVILNLINNAFYAVNERQINEKESGYKPRVILTTSKQGDLVVIEVADNGTGMTEQVKEKIFQPFFTTKPTGEGTGLGLSLSYDIVTKGHGGELRVETKEGVGTEFIIQLPIV